MKICGLQKMTLLDFPERVACTVFLGGCNFRCPYCLNFDLVTGKQPTVLEEKEFFDFLRTRKGRLDGVAITGGEPCLSPDLPEFMQKIRDMGFMVKLDTNGSRPEMLAAILSQGLADYIAMDIKNSPEKYAMTIGARSVDLTGVTKSVELLKGSSVACEFRTTVVDELHQAEDFERIGAWIEGARRYYLQAFSDRDSVPFAGFHAPSPEKMQAYAKIAAGYVKEVSLRGV